MVQELLTSEEKKIKSKIRENKNKMNSKHEERLEQEVELVEAYKDHLATFLNERELRLIRNCLIYSDNDPAGLPGHNIMIVVSKLAEDLGIDMLMIDYALGNMSAKDYVLGSEAMDRLHD